MESISTKKWLTVLFVSFILLGWGQYSGSGSFEKISSLAELTDGYYVVLESNEEYAMNNSYNGTFLDRTAVSPASNELIDPSSAIVWLIETNGGGRTIYNESIERYVSYTGSNNNIQVVTSVSSDNQRWDIAYSSNEFIFSNVATPTRILQYNPSAPRFVCYTSNQRKFTLYKLQTSPTITISETSISGLDYQPGNGPSLEQSFTIEGSNLTASVTLNAPSSYEISLFSDQFFSSSLSISPAILNSGPTTIYVRLKTGLSIGVYDEILLISSPEADNEEVNLSGKVSNQCGFENFDNASLTASYLDGSFLGNDGVSWVYGHSRNEGDYPIDGNGIMLRRASDSYLEATLSGGIGAFSFEYRKAFTGGADRQLELIIDGESVATTPVFGTIPSTEETDVYTFSFNVNTEDDVTVRIKNVGSTTTNRQTVIDNITWTCFEPCLGVNDFFRTKNSGNWSDFSIWEFSEDGVSNWQDANCSPDFEANEIQIQNDHNVNIVNDLTIDQVVIQDGGVLTYSNGDLTIMDGAGDDLIIEEGGIFVFDGGNVPSYENSDVRIRVQSGGKIRVDENTSGLSSNIAGNLSSNRVIYENGSVFHWNTFSVFASSNQTYFPDVDEATIPTFRTSVNLGNIGANEPNNTTFNGIFEANTNATFVNSGEKIFRNGIIGSGNISQGSTSGRFYFAGPTAYLGGTGIINLNFERINVDIDVELILLSNKTINTTATNPNLGQLRMTNGSTIDMGAYQLNGSANIRFNSDIAIKTSNLNGLDNALGSLAAVDFITPFNQTLEFYRSGTQNSGNTILPNEFGSIIVSNGAHLNLQKSIELNDSIAFFDNSKIILQTSDEIYLKNTDSDAIKNANTTGSGNYIEGRLRWATSNNAYTFPVGHASQNAQGFTIDVAGSGEILGYLEPNTSSPIQSFAYCDLETSTSPGQQVGEGTIGQDGILDQVSFNLASPLQWNITNPNGGVSSYNLEVSANGGQDINPVQAADGTAIRYLMKNGEPGNVGVATGQGLPTFEDVGFLACPNQYSLSGLTSFSEFTLNGASQDNTLLPVEMLYINAKAIDNNFIKLNWATGTEINNDGFEIQRSINGKFFETLGFVEGAGNYAGKLDYNYDDLEVEAGIYYYYRLKQMDYDGAFEYSKIVVASLNSNFMSANINIYPVPTSNNITIQSDVEIINIFATDLSGKKISLQTQKNDNDIQVNLSNLSAGVYYFDISTVYGREIKKVIKQ